MKRIKKEEKYNPQRHFVCETLGRQNDDCLNWESEIDK